MEVHLKSIKQLIRSARIALGNVDPDIDQILFGLGGLPKNAHIQGLAVVLR